MDLGPIAGKTGIPLRILVTRLRYLGDIVLTTPVIEALAECMPDASIWYMADKPYSQVLRSHPRLDGIIETGRGAASALSTVRSIRRLRFAAAIDLFYNPRSANLLRMSGIPVRIGGARRWRRRLYTHLFDPGEGRISAISHHLSSIRELGCTTAERRPRIFLDDMEIGEGRSRLESIFGGPIPGRLIALHAGGTWPAKRWPASYFARLSALAKRSFGAHSVVVTGPGEEAISAIVESGSGGTAKILPTVGIRQAASVIACCSAMVANDGGVMHMAVALGIPTVGVFGPTEPEIWFPYEGMGPYRVISRNEDCAPCHLHECSDPKCLSGIRAETVAGALADVTGW